MKKLIAVAAFAAYAACGAQYPLNRVSAVRDLRPVGITEDEANGLIRSYDATNLTGRISAKQDALEAGSNIVIEGNVISADLSGGLPPPDYGTVSNRAMNARQLRDNTCRRTSVDIGEGDWVLDNFRTVIASWAATSGKTLGSYVPGSLAWDAESSKFVLGMGQVSVKAGSAETFYDTRGVSEQTFPEDEKDDVDTVHVIVEMRLQSGEPSWVTYPGTDFYATRPSTPVAIEGESFVTRSFVDAATNSVLEAAMGAAAKATEYSVTSNGTGYVTLDPNPNKLLFGNGNGLSNLVVNIILEMADRGTLHVTTGGVRMSGWTVTR